MHRSIFLCTFVSRRPVEHTSSVNRQNEKWVRAADFSGLNACAPLCGPKTATILIKFSIYKNYSSKAFLSGAHILPPFDNYVHNRKYSKNLELAEVRNLDELRCFRNLEEFKYCWSFMTWKKCSFFARNLNFIRLKCRPMKYVVISRE